MDNNIQLFGRVTSPPKPKPGEKKVLPKPHISHMDKFHNIFEENPGKKFIMDITILEPDDVIYHVWYIMKMIVPAFIKGHLEKGTILSPREALEEILNECEIFYKTEKERHLVFNWKTYQPECGMPAFQLEYAIEWLHKYCLQHFNISIGNTKII